MIQLSLNSRNWIAFKVGDYFEISTGSNIAKSQIKEGQLPRITAKATDNGVDAFTNLHVRYRLNENCVSISFLGNAFYQPYKASYDMKIHSVTLIGRSMNQYIGLFLANQFNREFKKFSYGNQLSSTDLPKQHILLPVTDDNQPDWQFMEEYMRQQEIAILQPTIERLRNQLKMSELGGGKKEHLEWKEFKFTDIFTLRKGNQNNMASLQDGAIPLVSAKKCDNGYKQFVNSNNKTLFEGNILTINNDGDGGAGIAYYQPYKMALDSHCTALMPHAEINRFQMLFVAWCITKQRERYGHGYSLNNARLRSFRFMLPITKGGQPNWQFMSDYMKHKEHEILKTTLHHFEEKLTA